MRSRGGPRPPAGRRIAGKADRVPAQRGGRRIAGRVLEAPQPVHAEDLHLPFFTPAAGAEVARPAADAAAIKAAPLTSSVAPRAERRAGRGRRMAPRSRGAEPPRRELSHRDGEPLIRRLRVLLAAVWLVALGLALCRLADDNGWWTFATSWSYVGSAVATWCALVLLAWRTGGRYVLVACFSAVALALVIAYPEDWAAAGAAVVAAVGHGVLGMVMTRPAKGPRALLELVFPVVMGLVGAVVVTGYAVELRPYRFRILVITLALAGALALAWRLTLGLQSLGRRGVVAIVGGIGLIAVFVAYAQAVRTWGSPDVVAAMTDAKVWVRDLLGASPRPIEAVVGIPALVWGVATRSRRRQGWWMCSFGALGVAGIASSMNQPMISLEQSLQSTALNVAIGATVGLVLITIDRLLTGSGGRRVRTRGDTDTLRPEPHRFSPLL